MIDKVCLYFRENGRKKSLGERNCMWDDQGKTILIRPGEGFSFVPIRGNINDIFGYKGHFFEVSDKIKDSIVYISANDIKGKKSRAKTNFTVGEIDEKLYCHNDEEYNRIHSGKI